MLVSITSMTIVIVTDIMQDYEERQHPAQDQAPIAQNNCSPQSGVRQNFRTNYNEHESLL